MTGRETKSMEEIDNRLNEFKAGNELGNNTDNTIRMTENGNKLYQRQLIPPMNHGQGINMNSIQDNPRALVRHESEDSDDDNLSSDDDDFLENGNPLIVCV